MNEASIQRYTFGNPLHTGAVVKDIAAQSGLPAGWKIDSDQKTLTRPMQKETVVYGLGETLRGINKRGWLYTSYNSDEPHHEEGKHSLYASHNFLIFEDKDKCVAIFIDHPGRVNFDIGYSDKDMVSISFEDFDFDMYLIEGESPEKIVTSFRKLTGRSYIPPKWAFGYGQSRWGYKTADDIRTVAKRYKELNIPLDMIYMDIDYMKDFKDFTVNPERFPDFPSFVKEMKDMGIRLIPIIDAGVKIEEGYDVYEEGVKEGFFCKKDDGTNLVAAVWPGKVHFPDFLNSKAREWFGDKYKTLTDAGIEGFWNDMNEPAIFYTEDHLKEVFSEIKEMENKELDIWGFFQFRGLIEGIANNGDDYRRFFHDFDGIKVCHDKVHNLYGFYMTMAASQSFERNNKDKRILMFSRASYTGMHRYGGVWTGDNMSWWSHLLLNVKQMPSLNMTGFLYTGADLGGFGCDTTEDLVMRWLEFGIFTPLFRNHSALGTREQELYQFKDNVSFKNIIELRYSLIPYIYSEFMKAALNDGMYIKPLSFEYPSDKRVYEVEDQVLVGESIMVSPVYEQNKTGRYVYLPEDMKLVRFRSYNNYDEEILSAGDHYVKAELNEVLVFIRKGHVLPLAKPAMHVDEIDYSTLSYITYDADSSSYNMYNDDGVTPVNS
ncbi:glycoside hydrolase family 31 protein [Butyrivibrio sp. YAB3001]|uniref:glycoside hydrolase family 31 protein n=1 Tax=Butyrivibrio sp. YAB3001 TaxID=1520812 RepID=UPI0008F62BBD|nr:TIM-barrel domain-containing protein [Butyrivibrio sp. YAB3001]SFB87947.1 alpha-glucosidase [Butyrivibrio sp. YAB3001]